MEAQRKVYHLWEGVGFFLFACFFSGALGDIPDGVVYTDLDKTVQKGNTTILKCEFYGDPIAVYWKKGDNPELRSNLIAWVDGNEPSGSCVTDNACDMGEHYSLIIRNARISDQGRYICRVSNYLGILIHNYTDVKIYAPPKEPFPIIDKCIESESSPSNSTQPCSVLTNTSTVFITCTVINYYPDLDLFFLHGSQQILDTTTKEWRNDDETKNKSISIKASASATAYVCVASSIPGSNGQRAATILVNGPIESTTTTTPVSPTSSSTNGMTTDIFNDNRATKIAVPIVLMVLIVGIGIVMFFVFRRWRRKRHSTTANGSDIEEQVSMLDKTNTENFREPSSNYPLAGDMSFYELWSLAYDTPEHDMGKIGQVLVNLGFKNSTDGLTPANTYSFLCKWKEENEKEKQAKLLRKALESANFQSRWMQLCEQRLNTSFKVPQLTLIEIILDINDPEKIQRFLNKLMADRSLTVTVEGTKKDHNEEAMILLREWRKGPFEKNPFVLLSLALERSGCSSFDWIYFGGMISFFELWSLSHYLKDNDTEMIRCAFEELNFVTEDRLTEEELYDHLCSWKDSNKTINQGKLLRDALDKANLKKAWKDIHDLRRRENTQVSQPTIEHILWHIKDPPKIDQFLQKLTLNDPGTLLDATKGLRATIREGMTRLKIWVEKGFDENPFVLLSLALEDTGCSPVDRSFFKVPHELTQEIDEFKVQWFVDNLTNKHIKALSGCLHISKTEDFTKKENKETIFNTESMISDWITQEECSNYEKRWKLNKAVDSIGRQDLKDFFGKMKPAMHIGVRYETSSAHTKGHEVNCQRGDFIDDAFQRIATYLSPSQLKGLSVGSDDLRNAIRPLAEHRIAKKPKQDLREKLCKKLRPAGFQDLIPSEVEDNVYLCELLDVAFRLFLEDVYPLAKALGITDEKLKQYRVDYAPHHLTKGTTAALIRFSEANDNDRSKVCQVIRDGGYTDIALLLQYGHEISLADEFAVVSKAGDNGEALVKVSQNLRMSNNRNTVTVVREWRAIVHSPSYNHRTSLADAVFPVLGADVAVAIIGGKYRASSEESPAVIQKIISGIESFEQPFITKILDANDAKNLPDQRIIAHPKSTSLMDKRGRTDVNQGLPSDGLTESRSPDLKGESDEMATAIGRADKSAIARRLAQILSVNVSQQSSTQETSISQVIETWGKKKPLGKHDRKKLSDDLLKAGFREFAFEIMIGSVPRPPKRNKLPWKRGKQQKEGKQDKLADSVDNDEQASDGIEEQDSSDNDGGSATKAIKDSSDPAIKESGVQASADSGDPASKESDVQANSDSGDPPSKENGVQASADSGDLASKVSGVQASLDSGDPASKDSDGKTSTESGDPAIKDCGNQATKGGSDHDIKDK